MCTVRELGEKNVFFISRNLVALSCRISMKGMKSCHEHFQVFSPTSSFVYPAWINSFLFLIVDLWLNVNGIKNV